MYRVGVPGWKFAARIGCGLSLRVEISYDMEAQVYWAQSPDLDGLAIEAETYEELKRETLSAVELLLEDALNVQAPPATRLRLTSDIGLGAATCPA